jgi:flagellar motor switch protein FliN/FliY
MAEEATKEEAQQQTEANNVEFDEAQETGGSGSSGNIDILLDMNVPVTVAIGKTEMPVRKLLSLNKDSVLKLDKPIDNPADIYIKDTKFATGDVVTVNGKFAIKIRNITGFDNNTSQPGQSKEDQQHE